MSLWFERRAGSEETLLALYDAVQAAEELDLEEQAHDETFWAELRVLYDWPWDEPDEVDEPAEVPEPDDANEPEHVSMSQAIGIIEHLLGGRPMHGGGRTAT